MPRKRYSTDRHEAPSGRGSARPGAAHAPGLQEAGYQRADVLPLAGGWWIAVITDAASST